MGLFKIPASDLNSSKAQRQRVKIKQCLVYAIRNRFSRQHRPLPSDQPTVIVSLTSFPQRIHCVHLTIESLFEQSFPAEKVILWLSSDEFQQKKLPKTITRLEKRGLEVQWVKNNLKPYKKLCYALKAYPNKPIITVDDDTLYPNYLIEGLMDTHQHFPNAVICYRSKKITYDNSGKLLPYSQWESDSCTTPNAWTFPHGVGGVLYPAQCLSKQTLNEELFTQLSPTADDIWFKAMALLNNTLTMRVTRSGVEFAKVIGSQSTSLHKINNQKKQNDVQLKQVFEHFNIDQQSISDLIPQQRASQ